MALWRCRYRLPGNSRVAKQLPSFWHLNEVLLRSLPSLLEQVYRLVWRRSMTTGFSAANHS
jgi:hypothetical protein